ncbi:MAG: cupin domain-containing protein [Methanobrevibacter sp.]|nr:cupin domain-containing protein [Methanobrevibacter sp.]
MLSNGTNSWDGVEYETYPSGTPQLTVLKITIPPNKSLDVHTHPMPNVAYVEEGSLTVKKQANGEIHTINKGDVLREMVNEPHYGYTNEKGVVLICFYAGTPGLPLSIPVKE